ncbi:MAG: glycoside hydrolase family 2 protein [Salibacteraceae bacterium]
MKLSGWLLCGLLSCVAQFAFGTNSQKQMLNEGWQCRQANSTKWWSATVPGSVQQDLIHQGLLGDPRVGDQETEGEWVAQSDWEFRKSFALANLPQGEMVTFRFPGLDTYAEVYLNDSLLFSANNMFRAWQVTWPRNQLRAENQLRIYFHSPIKKGLEAQQALGYPLPASNDAGAQKVSSFVRKAPYQFGWDWAPRVVTCGIWKTPYIEVWDQYRFESFRILQTDLTETKAVGQLIFTIAAKAPKTATLNGAFGDQTWQKEVQLQPGLHEYALPFELVNPKWWWPNGWGNPHLYACTARVEAEKHVEEKRKRFGFRTVELRQSKDAIGTAFEFWVNGQPLFVKGANYVPQNIFPAAEATTQSQTLLLQAHAAHFNMLRLWGGGHYESEQFYSLCDSLGLLVWQDFMFACSMYPWDESYLANVAAEAEEQVGRLVSHPCLALWCGNNEVNVAWLNWGWQKQFEYSRAQQKEIYKGYQALFEKCLPNAVAAMAPGTPYIHSSPLSNWGKDENFNHHNMHYWGVWHGTDNFDGMERYVPRFMSEYGFQSFPAPSAYTGELEEVYLNKLDPLVQYRQKSYKTTFELERHLEQHYPNSRDYATFAYLSQLNQRLAMDMAIRAQRKDRTRCSGTLYWQFNDVWAATTWSTIDEAGNWKAAHYRVIESYQPLSIVPEKGKSDWQFHLANDHLTDQ